MCSEVCVELSVDVDHGRLAGGVLHHQEEFGHNLDHMSGLEHEVPFPFDRLAGETARYVGLAPHLLARGGLKTNMHHICKLLHSNLTI